MPKNENVTCKKKSQSETKKKLFIKMKQSFIRDWRLTHIRDR